jgi:phosphohistidine swiveling domain-containing protein
MAGQSSQAGYVAFMTQPTPDTFPGSFNSTAIGMKLRSGGIGTNRELMIPDPEIGGGRDVNDAYLGAVSWAGDLEFYGRFNAMLTLLYGALGIKYVKTPGGTNHVTTLTLTGAPTGGSFTLTYSAQTTAAIPYNATAAQIQSALEALSNIAEGEVDCNGGPLLTAPVTITWYGTLAGVITNPTVTPSFTGGTSPLLTPTTTTAGAAYTGASTHTFVPSDGAQLPFIAIQERIGASLETYNYTDAVINTFHLEADADGYLMGTAGIIARKQEAGITGMPGIASAFDNLPMVVGTNITFSYNGITIPGKSFSVDINNNYEDDDFRLGSFYLGDLTPKRREVTLGLTIREQDSSIWRQATYGSAAATQPGGLSTKQPVVINMQTYEAIPGAGGTLKYTLELTFPQVALKPFTLEASGDDIIESDLEYQALRPNPQRKIMYAEVATDLATVA